MKKSLLARFKICQLLIMKDLSFCRCCRWKRSKVLPLLNVFWSLGCYCWYEQTKLTTDNENERNHGFKQQDNRDRHWVVVFHFWQNGERHKMCQLYFLYQVSAQGAKQCPWLGSPSSRVPICLPSFLLEWNWINWENVVRERGPY